MTLLRRAPREVYRVYDEAEFLACADHGEPFQAVAARGERRLQRVAGATMLLAVTGAVGGLVAITSLSSTAGGARRSGGLLASADAALGARSVRAQMWRAPAKAGLTARRPAPRRIVVSAPPQPETQPEPVRQPEPVPQPATSQQPVKQLGSAPATQPETPQPPAGQSEFGFER
jgi:hypothetical protein